jgi:hypothetical protein
MKGINVTKEYNIGPSPVLYEKYKPIIDRFPAEISEMILSYLPEEDKIILSERSEEEVEDFEYDLPDYEEDFELFGNQIEEDFENDDYFEDDYF